MTVTTERPDVASPAAPRAASPLRVALSGLLIAIVAISTVSAIVAWWADNAVYSPDIMIAAFGDLPDDPEQADKLGAWIAAETVEGLDVEARLTEALPIGLSLFSGTLTEGIERSAATASSRLIQTEFFAEIWEDALPAAHATMIGALEGSGEGLLEADGGVVSLDISRAILATYEALINNLPDVANNAIVARITGLEPGDIQETIDGWVLANLPADLGSLVLLESEALAALQEWKTQLGRMVWLSALAALLAAAAAIVISPRAGRALAVVGVALVVATAIGVLAVGGAERAVINALSDLPFDRQGFDPGALLTGWFLAIVIFILTAVGVGVAGFTLRWRAAAPESPTTGR